MATEGLSNLRRSASSQTKNGSPRCDKSPRSTAGEMVTSAIDRRKLPRLDLSEKHDGASTRSPRSAKPPPLLPPLTSMLAHRIRRSVRVRKRDWRPSPTSLRSWATLAPLLSALMAPLSTLLDIPALTQHWYSFGEADVDDATTSLVLSAVGLGFNVLANILLVVRFSASKHWRIASHVSLVAWLIKTAIALVNVCLFGRIHADGGPGYTYAEGFWCAVASLCFAGIISLILTFHAVVEIVHPASRVDDDENPEDIRQTGRHFMLSVSALIVLIGIEALVFSRVEGWTFLDGCYFSVVTGFTIGLGDFEPTETSTRILLFPFALASITYLASQIRMIINYIGERAAARRARWRDKFETIQRQTFDERDAPIDLVTEMRFLDALASREQFMTQLYDLWWSVVFLVALWVIGALSFSHIEGLPYGDAFYFVCAGATLIAARHADPLADVVLLTIGYGDIAAKTAGGRVFFVVFVIAAVPIVTFSAIQTVSGLLGALADAKMKRVAAAAEKEKHADAFTPHSDWIQEYGDTIDARIAGWEDDADVETFPSKRVDDVESQLSIALLDLAIRLEWQSRHLLIEHLRPDSREQTLLRADQHVQLKVRERILADCDALGDDAPLSPTVHDRAQRWRLAIDTHPVPLDAPPPSGDPLAAIRDYRKTFAALLAVGSRILALEGVDRCHFERRLRRDDEPQSPSSARARRLSGAREGLEAA